MSTNVLFVCTGNICRSPIAEGILKKLIFDKNRSMQISSSGILAIDGMPASLEAQKVCQEIQVDISKHKSQTLTRELILKSDCILTMTQNQYWTILDRLPHLQSKVHLLSNFSYNTNENILDPMGKDLDYYREVRDQIFKYVYRLIDQF